MAGFGNLLDGDNEEFQVSGLGDSGATNRFRVKRRSKFGTGKMRSLLNMLRLSVWSSGVTTHQDA